MERRDLKDLQVNTFRSLLSGENHSSDFRLGYYHASVG